MYLKRIKEVIKDNYVIFQNMSYITLLELFIVVSPLITYPYLVKVLGTKLYGLVITAQIIASYAVILVNFGFRSITAKDISIHRDNKQKLSEIISSILCIRITLWVLSFIIYWVVISIIPSYNKYMLLFLFSFGITFNELLFPQFYFQGIEKMKFITYIRIGINSAFIILTFLYIKSEADYYLVPLFRAIGLFLGGITSLYIIFFKHKIKFTIPKIKVVKAYMTDASPIFSTQIITSIKDKFSYILLGSFVGMQEVVIYDLGTKFTSILVKPITILSQVMLPKIARERNVKIFKKITYGSMVLMVFIVLIFNLILPFVVNIFIQEPIDLLPLRVFSLAPLFLAVSSFIASNGLIAFGYNKYILYSIIVTTIVYVVATVLFYFTDKLDNVMTFVIITVLAYLAEFIYRFWVSKKLIINHK